jgi:hypothetical protein
VVPSKFGEEVFAISVFQWDARRTCMDYLDGQLPMMQGYLKGFWDLTKVKVEEVEDEVGGVGTEIGDGNQVYVGLYPTMWKGISGTCESALSITSNLKHNLNDVSENVMMVMVNQVELKAGNVLKEINGLKRDPLQNSPMHSAHLRPADPDHQG